jgi:hypothetical protein
MGFKANPGGAMDGRNIYSRIEEIGLPVSQPKS